MLKMLVMVSEEQRCVDDKGRKKCREAHLGGMRAATQHSCFSAQYRCTLESELYSCGIDLHVAHVVSVTVEPRTWCCFILCFQAQTVSSSTNGAGCHDSHPGACGIDWLMSLGNGPCRDCLRIQFYLLPPSSAIANKNFSPYIVQAIF